MKNLLKLFSVLMVMIGSFAFGQNTNPSEEEVVHNAAKMIIGIKNSTQKVFNESRSYEDFRFKLIGKTGKCSTEEGENLLAKVYEMQSKRQTDEEIYQTYNGNEIGLALRKYKELGYNDSKLFNEDTSKLAAAEAGGCDCRWYQLGCWFDCVFGPKLGPKVLEVLVDILIAMIPKG